LLNLTKNQSVCISDTLKYPKITIVVFECGYCNGYTSAPQPVESLVLNKTGEEVLFCSAMCKSLFIAEEAGVFIDGR
jgi:hypothetical protein